MKVMTTLIGSSLPAGTVAYTKPSALSVIPKGSLIKVYVSKGGYTKVPDVRGK